MFKYPQCIVTMHCRWFLAVETRCLVYVRGNYDVTNHNIKKGEILGYGKIWKRFRLSAGRGK